MKSVVLAALACSALLTGCVEFPEPAAIVPQATGGDRGQGSIEMSYEKPPILQPRVDWMAAQSAAVHRCSGWGFTGAQAYANDREECIAFRADGSCNRLRVTRIYQCTGNP